MDLLDKHSTDGPNDNPAAWTANDMTPEQVRERIAVLEERVGDASCCSDGECGCHRTAREARDELDALLDNDPIDAWKRLRDMGYDELELRAAWGDR